MSKADKIKLRLLEQIAQIDDPKMLEHLQVGITEILRIVPDNISAEAALVRKGRAQLAQGKSHSLDDVMAAMEEGIQEGLRKRAGGNAKAA